MGRGRSEGEVRGRRRDGERQGHRDGDGVTRQGKKQKGRQEEGQGQIRDKRVRAEWESDDQRQPGAETGTRRDTERESETGSEKTEIEGTGDAEDRQRRGDEGGEEGAGPRETERHSTGRDRKRALRPCSASRSGPRAAVAQAAPGSTGPAPNPLLFDPQALATAALPPKTSALGPGRKAQPLYGCLALSPRPALPSL